MDRVSAIITTHNRSSIMLERALISVFQQSYENIEIIVVDDSDASFEGKQEIQKMMRKYQMQYRRLQYIQHKVCKGLPAARNTGILHSSGKYIAFLDDDDEWLPEKTEKQVSVFEKNERKGLKTALVYSNGYLMDDSTGKTTKMRCKYRRGYVFDELLFGNWIGFPSFVMVQIDCINEVGGFDESIPYMEDFDLYLRLAKENAIDYAKGEMGVYHDHDGEQMTDDTDRYIKGLEYIGNKFDYDIEQRRKVCLSRQRKLSQAYAEDGHLKKAHESWNSICQRLNVNLITAYLGKFRINKTYRKTRSM